MFACVANRRSKLAGFVAGLLSLCVCAASARADVSQKAVERARRYLDNQDTAKSVLSFVHFGASYAGDEYVETDTVNDGHGRERPGYFALVYSFKWEDDGVTKMAFFFDRDGDIYQMAVLKTNAVIQQPFVAADLAIQTLASVLENAMSKDWSDQDRADFHQLVDKADSHGLLNLYLRLKQPR